MALDIEKFTETETRANQARKLNRLAKAVEDGGGDPGDAVDWDTLAGKPDTFPPVVGTTATTAKAGNWTPTIADVDGLQDALDLLDGRITALENAAG